MRPAIVELEVVNLRVLLEQFAVVAGIEVQALVPLVNAPEESEEVLPAWVRDQGEGRQTLPRRLDALGGKQPAIFAESDEDDPVDDLLGDANGGIYGLVVNQAQVLDQFEA